MPDTVKEIQNLTTVQIKQLLRNRGFTITGSRDELILRLYLVGKGYHHLVFYHQLEEIHNTIKDADQLILEERQDYLTHPEDTYRKRTYSTQQIKNESQKMKDVSLIDPENLHKMFED